MHFLQLGLTRLPYIFIMDPLFTGDHLNELLLVCCAWLFSHVQLFANPWTVAHQAPLSMGILQARILERVALPSSRGSSQPRGRIPVSHIAGEFFTN